MAGPIRISILANAKQAVGEINEVGESAERSTGRAKSALKGLAAGFVAFEAFSKVKDALKESLVEAREAQKINAQTAAVIKSTGSAAHVTADHVHEYAEAIGRSTGQNADLIQSNANVLLTFKNVQNQVGKGNNIFDQATQTVVDMSTALGKDGKSSAIQLGKALNDPVKGLTALSRVGVQFNAQQTNQIKKMAASGHTLGAQKIILKELTSEFGGSAKAQATAGDKLRETWREVEEEIGKKLLPILDKVETYVAKNLPEWMAKGEEGVDKVKSAFEKVQPFIETVVNFLKKNPDTVKTFAIVLGVLVGAVELVTGAMAALDAVMAVNPFVLAAIAIAALAAGLVYAYKHSEKFRAVVDATFSAIKTIVTTVIPAIVGFIKSHWAPILILLTGPIGIATVLIVKNFDKIIAAIKLVGQWGKWLWNNVFQPVLKFIIDAVGKVLKVWAGLLRAVSKVPGFGWVGKIADGLDKAAGMADTLAQKIRDIPSNKSVKVVLNVVDGVVHTTGGHVPRDAGSGGGGSAAPSSSRRSLAGATVNVTVQAAPQEKLTETLPRALSVLDLLYGG